MKKESKDGVLMDHFLLMLFFARAQTEVFYFFHRPVLHTDSLLQRKGKKGETASKVWLLVSRILPLQIKKPYLSALLDHGKYDGLWF